METAVALWEVPPRRKSVYFILYIPYILFYINFQFIWYLTTWILGQVLREK